MNTFAGYSGNEVAGEPLAADTFVHISGGEIVTAGASTDNVIGIVTHACATGERPDIAGIGAQRVVKLAAGQNPASGVDLTCAAGGIATSVLTNKDRRVARTLAAASGEGGYVRVIVLDGSKQSI